VEGSDFQFGRGRGGSIATLRVLESAHHYQTIVIEPVDAALSDQSLVRVSSSMIRWLLGHGRVRDAALLLGRPYELISKVVSGDKRGREIGMPTVNLAPNECLLPADGIYAGYAIVANHHSDAGRRGNGEISYPAAISVGTKPTFGEHPRVCEAHLVGYDGPLDDYGWTLRLQFTDWIRDQLKYERVDLLIDQLKRDIERVRQATSSSESNQRRGVQSASENTQTSSTGLSATLR
jgi:riboflavin kinase/FMN adenylyltransferase